MSVYFYTCSLFVLLVFSSCSNKHQNINQHFSTKNATEQVYQGHYKIGKPYSVNDVTYVPYTTDNQDHVEHGKASWYGQNDHNKKTANGDTFSKYMLTAAHPRLPLSSIVKVTNLDNNKELIVMVNDLSLIHI